MTTDLTTPIAREGEQQFACIMRERSGIDSGRISSGVRVFEIEELSADDQADICSSAFALLCSVLKHVPEDIRKPKVAIWIDRVRSYG